MRKEVNPLWINLVEDFPNAGGFCSCSPYSFGSPSRAQSDAFTLPTPPACHDINEKLVNAIRAAPIAFM